jgi:hypothetical protein
MGAGTQNYELRSARDTMAQRGRLPRVATPRFERLVVSEQLAEQAFRLVHRAVDVLTGERAFDGAAQGFW